MINFCLPPISLSLSKYMEVVRMWDECSSCIGFCVSLGNTFISTGRKEVDDHILPALSEQAESNVSPRVLPSYAILYWFTLQVCIILFSIKGCYYN